MSAGMPLSNDRRAWLRGDQINSAACVHGGKIQSFNRSRLFFRECRNRVDRRVPSEAMGPAGVRPVSGRASTSAARRKTCKGSHGYGRSLRLPSTVEIFLRWSRSRERGVDRAFRAGSRSYREIARSMRAPRKCLRAFGATRFERRQQSSIRRGDALCPDGRHRQYRIRSAACAASAFTACRRGCRRTEDTSRRAVATRGCCPRRPTERNAC